MSAATIAAAVAAGALLGALAVYAVRWLRSPTGHRPMTQQEQSEYEQDIAVLRERFRRPMPPASDGVALPPRPRLVASRVGPPSGPVPRIMTAALEPAKAQRVELGHSYVCYVAVCRREGLEALTPDQFMDAMAVFCKGAGIKTRIEADKLYLLNVRLAEAADVHRNAAG